MAHTHTVAHRGIPHVNLPPIVCVEGRGDVTYMREPCHVNARVMSHVNAHRGIPRVNLTYFVCV